MAASTSPLAALSRILDKSSLIPDAELDQYAVEGVVPGAAVFPISEEQVAAVLGIASKEGWSVVPRGNGSLVSLGGVPSRVDVVLGITRLERSTEHAPGDLTATVGAGSTLESLQQALAREGQWLPLDPPLFDKRSVGGMLATNLAGPLSQAFGTARDMVIGMRVAGPDGPITKSGGKVVKNVTGFDVAKAHLGALGTLGIILEASFKVAPLPESDYTLVATFESLGEAADTAQVLMGHPSTPQAVETVLTGTGRHRGGEEGGQPGCVLYARFLGTRTAMERRLDEGSALLRNAGAGSMGVVGGEVAGQTWRWLADFGWDPNAGEGMLLRLGCMPSQTRQLATEVEGLAEKEGYDMSLVVGPGRGVTRCFMPGQRWFEAVATQTAVGQVREVASSVGGYAVVERCPAQVKPHVDVWGDPGEGLALMRRLKERMDPGGVLNPGRFVGGI